MTALTKPQRMAIYREAARRIAERENLFMCAAIAASRKRTLHGWEELDVFKQSALAPKPLPTLWYESTDREPRILTLLLAEQMVRTGDL